MLFINTQRSNTELEINANVSINYPLYVNSCGSGCIRDGHCGIVRYILCLILQLELNGKFYYQKLINIDLSLLQLLKILNDLYITVITKIIDWMKL